MKIKTIGLTLLWCLSCILAAGCANGGNKQPTKPAAPNQPVAKQETKTVPQEMEKKIYLEIITGVKELDEFDRFVEEWMEAGGEQITLEVTEAVREAKGA